MVRPGNLLVIDTSQPHQAQTSDFTNITLVVPRRRMTSHLVAPQSHGSRVFSPDEPLARIAHDAVLSLWRNIPLLNPEQASAALNPTIDLVIASLNGHADATPPLAHAQDWMRRQRIRDYIERNLGDSTLSPASIQARFRISRAQIYSLFHGTVGIA